MLHGLMSCGIGGHAEDAFELVGYQWCHMYGVLRLVPFGLLGED
jgi:hypothetical protein